MSSIQQNVIDEIVEKFDDCNKLETPEPFFSIGKDIIPSCPSDADMRDFIDPLLEGMLFDKGYGYVKGLSNKCGLTFARLSDEQKIQWVAQKITVRVTSFTTCLVEGFDEFEEELRRMYNVQHENEWIPACCGPFEVGLCVTIGSLFLKFFTDIVLPGLAWDATKGIFASLWKGLEKLSKKTEDFDIRCMKYKFDDITIHIGDVKANNYVSILRLLLKMHENVQYLHSKGIDGINKISVPYMPSEYEEDTFDYVAPCDNYDHCWWKVSYMYGCSELYFNPDTMEMK